MRVASRDARRGARLSRVGPWIAGGVALTLANAWLVSFDVNQFDESWTLQVASRVASGESLYGDVWFGTTPLSMYVLVGFVSLLGEQIVVVKALEALLAAACGLLVARLGLQGGLSGVGAALLALLTVPLSPAVPVSLYTPLAMVFFLACESVVLGARGRPTIRMAVLAGTLAGLAFASKQNIGGLALLALAATVLLAEPSRAGVRRAAAAVAAFSAIAVATVAAMVATGGVGNTLDSLGLGKAEYLRYASVPYHELLVRHLQNVIRPEIWLGQLRGDDRDLFVGSPKVLLPVLTLLLLAAAWVVWARRPGRTRPEPRLLVVTSFAAAAFLGAFPLYDTIHLGWIAGPLLAACGVSLTLLPRVKMRGTRLALAGLALGWVAFVLAGPLSDWRAGPVRLGLPGFAGIWTPPETRAQAHDNLRRLHDAVPAGTVFIVSPAASFYYLAGGLENPTRYDFPVTTLIGQREVDDVMRRVAEGDVAAACLVSEPEARQAELERRLRAASRPGPDAGLCRIWLPMTGG